MVSDITNGKNYAELIIKSITELKEKIEEEKDERKEDLRELKTSIRDMEKDTKNSIEKLTVTREKDMNTINEKLNIINVTLTGIQRIDKIDERLQIQEAWRNKTIGISVGASFIIGIAFTLINMFVV